MRVLLIPLGSHGDVHPFIGLGVALRNSGHHVVVVTNPHFAGMIEAAGLAFSPIGTEEQFLDAGRDPDIWHPVKGFRLVMGYMASATAQLRTLLESLIDPGRTVIAAPVTAFAARNLEDAGRAPLVTVDLQPSILRSALAPPVLPFLGFVRHLPPPALRAFYKFVDKNAVDPLLAPAINADRAALGLPPVTRILEWWHSPRHTLALFPDWFAPPAPDWPPRVTCAGFPLFDERQSGAVHPNAEAFLNAGPPPIVFTAGSANRHAHAFFAAAVDACQRLDRRGMLLARFDDQIPKDLPDSVQHFEYVPFSRVLPKSAALVHHGGIGTTAQALHAGIPQVVTPLAHDQPDNAARLERLGVGRTLAPPRRVNGRALARALEAVLNDDALRQRARALAARIDPYETLETACRVIESALPTPVAT